jgi:CysZ protein
MGAYGSSHYVNLLSDYIFDLLGLELSSIDKSLGFWENVRRGGLVIGEMVVFLILKISLIYLFFRANKYIVLIFLSPIMAFLSERTEEIVTGNSYPFVLKQFIKDICRGIIVAIRNFALEMSITIMLLLIGLFLPIVSPFVSILLFFIGAYFYGFSTFDYINERKKRSIKESVRYLRANKGAVIGNGSMLSLFMLIPIIGTIYGSINATVGAVLTDEAIKSNVTKEHKKSLS